MRVTENGLLMHSIYTAITESNNMEFSSPKEMEEWQGKRTNEIFQELKAKYLSGSERM